MWAKKIYYIVKPLLPRILQIQARRIVARRQLERHRHIWPIDPNSAKPPRGWQGWPEGKRFALVLTQDVETARGQDRCRDLMTMEKELGFRSSFNFVPERYAVSEELRKELVQNGFEVGVHGLYHDGKYYESRKVFQERAIIINRYLKEWQAVGFRSPSMLHNLEWIHDLDIQYDASTFDTDPFEPQPEGTGTIFPFRVESKAPGKKGYVELSYTLPQDFTLFILMNHKDIHIWKRKMDWIVENGGMALINVHPDYMNFTTGNCGIEEYPSSYFSDLLEYVKYRYEGQYWHVLPKDLALYWNNRLGSPFAESPE